MKKIKELLDNIETRLNLKKIKMTIKIMIFVALGIIICVQLISQINTFRMYNKKVNLIETYVSKKEYDKAIKEVNKAMKSFKDSDKYLKEFKTKKKVITKIKENSEYEKCIKIAKSDNVDISDDQRIDAYTKAIDIKPKEEELYIQAASLFVQYNDYDKAVNLLSSGVDACKDGNTEEERETINKLTKKIDEINELMFNSEYNNLYLEMVSAYEEEDFDKVLLMYNQCIQKNKNDSRVYVLMGKTYFEENRHKEAIQVLKNGIDRMKSIGAMNKKSKQYEKYIYMVQLKKNYEKIQKVSSKYDDFYRNLLIGCKALKEKDSLKEIKKVLDKYDFSTIAACNNITYYTDKGMYVDKMNTGTGIAVYSNRYIYYGDWKDGERSGDGYLIAITKDGEKEITYMYEGAWRDNYPNGKGKIIYSRYEEDELDYETITEGSFVGGYEDGVMKLTKKGSSIECSELVMKYRCKKGEPQVIIENGKKKKSADGSFVIGYYYEGDKKREVAAIPAEGDNPASVKWRVNGLPY